MVNFLCDLLSSAVLPPVSTYPARLKTGTLRTMYTINKEIIHLLHTSCSHPLKAALVRFVDLRDLEIILP
jgi:hypothetical protein